MTNVARRRVSPRDERTAEQLAFGGMTGGDRMLHHGYGPTYARYLRPFLGGWNLTVAEFGILKGTGLAMWCDLFPDARVILRDVVEHNPRSTGALSSGAAPSGRTSPSCTNTTSSSRVRTDCARFWAARSTS